MLGGGLRQRDRPAPMGGIISIYQRLKSGAEFDRFGVKVCPAAAGDAAAIGRVASVVRNTLRVGDVFVGGVLCTLSAWVMEFTFTWLGLEPGRKLQLPLGLLLW
jgi:hypothetical protein